MPHVSFQPASTMVGAFVQGLDLSRPLSAGDREELLQALGRFGVLFFREQSLTPEQHIAFAQHMGQIDVNRFFEHVDGYPMIAQVRKEHEQKSNIGSGWHTDHSYDLAPALGSILYAREVPPVGGDTVFASMYAAYDALSEGLKETLGRLNALHSSVHVFGEGRTRTWGDLQGRLRNTGAATQEAVHPVVIEHPISGRKALYVNPDFTVAIDGWTEAESRGLLEYLYAHASKPEFQYRFQWQPGSLAFWDNRATWHYALNDYQGMRRLMHRITITGVPLDSRAPALRAAA
jgi:taurine dioxygenase